VEHPHHVIWLRGNGDESVFKPGGKERGPKVTDFILTGFYMHFC
jgi:hypothetical protein